LIFFIIRWGLGPSDPPPLWLRQWEQGEEAFLKLKASEHSLYGRQREMVNLPTSLF